MNSNTSLISREDDKIEGEDLPAQELYEEAASRICYWRTRLHPILWMRSSVWFGSSPWIATPCSHWRKCAELRAAC